MNRDYGASLNSAAAPVCFICSCCIILLICILMPISSTKLQFISHSDKQQTGELFDNYYEEVIVSRPSGQPIVL